MKTLIISLSLLLLSGLGHSQIIQLSEAKVGFEPVALEKENSFRVDVKENYAGEFEKDPLLFMEKNFDIQTFIELVRKENVESYHVSFRSRKGSFTAEFDEEGKLIETSQKFRNTRLPREISQQLYREYKGWTIAKNVHLASGKHGKLDSSVYLVTMKNGNKKEKLKIDASPSASYTVAQK